LVANTNQQKTKQAPTKQVAEVPDTSKASQARHDFEVSECRKDEMIISFTCCRVDDP
jgi:hypothetical protein